MFVKIDLSGCSERKGMVEVRLNMYLDSGDFGYDKHYVQLPDFEGQEYTGEVDKNGMPLDIGDYNTWVKTLPKIYQLNPFHNHFIQIEPTMTDKEIMDKAEVLCREAFELWKTDECKKLQNPKVTYPTITSELITACNQRVASLTEIIREVE